MNSWNCSRFQLSLCSSAQFQGEEEETGRGKEVRKKMLWFLFINQTENIWKMCDGKSTGGRTKRRGVRRRGSTKGKAGSGQEKAEGE